MRFVVTNMFLCIVVCLNSSSAEIPLPAAKEKATTERTFTQLQEIVVTAGRTRDTVRESPRSITVITEKRLAERNGTSPLLTLDDQPGIWICRQNSTEANPVIRGFSGTGILALVDGDTLSTLWSEGGVGPDDMYGKVEADSLDRIEVIRGPASLAYGSNCLGGIINLVTRKCPLDFAEAGKMNYGGRYKFTAGSAADEFHGRAEQWFTTSKLRFFAGGSARDVGPTRAGGGFIERNTGGDDKNFDTNAEIKLAANQSLELTYQHMDRDDVRRYHWPGQTNSNNRDAGHLLYAYRTDDWLRELSFKSYYQNKQDRRFWETTGVKGRERWDTFQETLQADMRFGAKDEHRVVAGLAFEADLGEDPDNEQFTKVKPDGTKTKDAPNSNWCDYGVFAIDEWKATDALTITYGVRVDCFTFSSEVDRFYKPPSPSWDPKADELSTFKAIPSAGAGFNYRVYDGQPDVRLFGNYSRGFRLNPPVFGVTQTAMGVQVPTPMQSPITADSFELGVRNSGRYMRGSLASYYTLFNHFQTQAPGTFNGKNWFDFNGDGVQQPFERVIAVSDSGRAHMYGVEWQQDFRVDQLMKAPGTWWIGGGVSYNRGEDENRNPLRFTNPLWGFAKLRWEQGDLWQESPVKGLFFEYEAKFVDRFDRIPKGLINSDKGYLRDPADAQSGLLRSYGLPGYSVHNVRIGLNVAKHWWMNFGVENFTDKNYREAHSRADAPGRNLWLGAEFTW